MIYFPQEKLLFTGDLVVTTEMEPAGDAPDGVDRLPAREAIYRTVASKGPISIEDLASEFSGMAPGGKDGHSVLITLQYVYALQRAVELESSFGVDLAGIILTGDQTVGDVVTLLKEKGATLSPGAGKIPWHMREETPPGTWRVDPSAVEPLYS